MRHPTAQKEGSSYLHALCALLRALLRAHPCASKQPHRKKTQYLRLFLTVRRKALRAIAHRDDHWEDFKAGLGML